MKKSIIFFILVLNYFIFAQNEDEVCNSKLYNMTNPLHCCEMPEFTIENTSINENCKQNPNDTDCTYYDCAIDQLKIFEGDKLNIKNMLNWYLRSGEIENISKTTWEKIAKENIKKCDDEIVSAGLSESPCKNPVYIDNLYDCIYEKNFLKCPNLRHENDCDDVKKFIESSDFKQNINSKYIEFHCYDSNIEE
ncbi:hypothetical protein PVAND_017278 [Polypedilum vanderplanki]|uniref:Uncharacterized protein n=1 Tax=Polypedilum vanderplanki TaxID=319348 RepID=A0A9J6BIK4_POLVA|nr:hypothetical protein PVAND_017278 [Polypedilum vanderplanki]